jgi:hypothetical protein
MNAVYQEEEEEERYEAVNIGLVASIYNRDFEDKLENLITEVLQDYGVIDGRRGDHAVIPAGDLTIEYDENGTWYYYGTGFEVFDRTGRRAIMIGRAAGKMILISDGTFEIEDLTIILERK